jgi:hypothetical protein
MLPTRRSSCRRRLTSAAIFILMSSGGLKSPERSGSSLWTVTMTFFEHNWAAPTDACQGIIKYNRVSVGCGGIKTMSAISINRSDWCRLVWLRNVPSD